MNVKLSRTLDIFGMLGAILNRWPVTEDTERIIVFTELKYIILPKHIKASELCFMNEDDVPSLPLNTAFMDDWVELRKLRGYNFESRVGYSEKLDYLVMAE
jgi:hypothetical protein